MLAVVDGIVNNCVRFVVQIKNSKAQQSYPKTALCHFTHKRCLRIAGGVGEFVPPQKNQKAGRCGAGD